MDRDLLLHKIFGTAYEASTATLTNGSHPLFMPLLLIDSDLLLLGVSLLELHESAHSLLHHLISVWSYALRFHRSSSCSRCWSILRQMVYLCEFHDGRGARWRIHADCLMTLASSGDLSGSRLGLAHDQDVACFLVYGLTARNYIKQGDALLRLAHSESTPRIFASLSTVRPLR